MGGPRVKGMEQSPSKNPIAWDAPEGPQISKAIGPSIVMKHPSKSPMIKENKIMDSKLNPSKNGAAVNNMVHIPMETNDTCWSRIRLTFGKSAMYPKIKRPTKDVMAIQVTRVLPFFSGKVSSTCWT